MDYKIITGCDINKLEQNVHQYLRMYDNWKLTGGVININNSFAQAVTKRKKKKEKSNFKIAANTFKRYQRVFCVHPGKDWSERRLAIWKKDRTYHDKRYNYYLTNKEYYEVAQKTALQDLFTWCYEQEEGGYAV